MQLLRALAVLAVLALPATAFAQAGPPHNTGKEGAYTRVGSPGAKIPVQTVLTTISYVNGSTGTQALKDRVFIPWGSIVHVEGCTEPTNFCFVQSVDDLALDQHGFVTDSATGKLDAMCTGFSVANGARDVFLGRHEFNDNGVATREGYCWGSTDALKPFNGWPCDETVDCPGASVCYTWLHHVNRANSGGRTLLSQIGGAFLTTVDADGVVTANTCQIDTEK